MKSGKVKKSQNESGISVDGKSTKSSDNSITKKNTKIKSFTDMISNVQTGPKSKK